MEPIEYMHTVQYYECDPMGVMHHSNYLRVMEESRVEWMDRLGFGYERMEAEGVMSPVTSIQIDYKSPARFRDRLRVLIHVEELGNIRLKLRYEMFVGDKLAVKAVSQHCFVENGRPISLERRFPDFYKTLSEQMK